MVYERCIRFFFSAVLILLINVSAVYAEDTFFDYSDLFGNDNYYHPFITMDMSWCDNIYEQKSSTVSDLTFYTRPGLWIAVPGMDVQAISVETATESPGGATSSRFSGDDIVRYQSYFLYSPEFENYIDNTIHNDINHKAEAFFLYNFPGGLSVELIDQLVANHDDIVPDTRNINYTNNLISSTFSYGATEKLRFRFDYSKYLVNYESLANIKDRTDSVLSGYVFFSVLPKTSLFFQYVNTDIDYKHDTNASVSDDNTEQGYLAGVRWEITDKTSGSFKAGFQSKKFDTGSFANKNIMKLELNADYAVTPRGSVSVALKNTTTETDVNDAFFILSRSILSSYQHSITERITGYFTIYYNNEDYGNIDRKDVSFDVSPSVSYVYNNWITLNAAYTHDTLNSRGNDSANDYDKNTLLLSVSASM